VKLHVTHTVDPDYPQAELGMLTGLVATTLERGMTVIVAGVAPSKGQILFSTENLDEHFKVTITPMKAEVSDKEPVL